MSTREIVLDGGSPWGFRMHGGADVGQPLRISRVNPGSKAALKGVREGDVISSINGQHTRSISNSDAHALLRNAGQTLHLGLNEECSGSPKRRIHRNVQQESKSDSVKRSTVTKTTTPVNGATDPNSNSQVWVKGDLQDGQNGGVKEISTGSTSDSKGPRRRRRLQSTPQHELSVDAKEDSDTIADKQDASKTLHSPTFSEGGGSKSRRRRRSRGNSRRKCRVGSALGVESVVSGTELKAGDQEREMSTTEPETDATMSDIGGKSDDFILHGGETSEVDTVEELASDDTKQKVIFKKVQLTKANVLSVDANKKSVLDVDHESKSTVGVSSSAIRDVGKERENDANVTSFTGREGSSLDDTRKKYTPGSVSWKYETSEPFYEKEIWEGGVKSNYRDDVGMETHGFEDKMRELNNTETASTQTLSARDVDALVEEMAGINVRSKETEHVKEIIQVKESPEDIKSKFTSQESTIEGLRENDVAQVDIGLLDKGKKISEEKYGYRKAAPSLSDTVCEDVVVETGVENVQGEVEGRTEFLINDETDAGTAGRQSDYVVISECPLMSEGSNAEAESRKCENVNATVGNVVELQVENDCNRDTKTQISRSDRVTEKGNTQGDVTDCNALHSVNDSSGLKFVNHVRENTQEHVKEFGSFVKNVSTICSAADTAVLGGITSLDSQEIRQNTGSEYSCGTLLHLPLTTDVSYSTGDQDCSSSETYECGIVKRSSESVIFNDTSFLREDYECTSSVEVRKSKAGECQDGRQLAAPCVSGSLETTESNLQSKLCSNIVNETGRVITGTRNSGAADERVVRYLEISAEGDECSTESQQKEAYTVSEQPLLEYRAVVESGEEEEWEEVEELCSTGKIRKDDRVAENTMPVGDGGCPVMSNTSIFLKNDELSQEEKELLDPSPLIDADDEATLRRFLHSLNLADYSREAVRTRNAVLRDGSSEEVYAIRKGKRRVALETYSSQQRSLDVIAEENGSDHSDGERRVEEAGTLEERRGRGWEEAIFIPETNQIMFLSNDSEKGEYEGLDNEGREGSRVRHRSIYYSEAKVTSYGMDSEERICRVYRREGNETRSMKTRFVSEDVSSDIFSEDMENALENADDTAECDSEDGREEASKDCDGGAEVKVELAESSEDEDDMEVMWTRGRARERLGAVEIVYLEEDSGSTSSGSCVAAKTTEEECVRESVVEEDPDVVYEEVEFPVRLRGIIRISDAAQEEFSESNHVNVIYENTEFHRNTETVFKTQQTETDIKNADIVDTLQCSAVNESLAGIYEDIEFVREEISPTPRVRSKHYDSSVTVAYGENNLIRLTDSSNAIHGSSSRPNADNMRECRGNDDHNRVTDQLKATKGDDPRDIEGEKLATVDEAKSIRQSESIIEFNAESESRVEADDTAVTNDLSKIQKMVPHQSSVTVNSPVPSDELSVEERKDGMHVSECVSVDNSTTNVSSKTVSTGERISSLMPKRENVDKNCLETAMPHPNSGISRVESLKENAAEAITVENDCRQEEGRIEISTQTQSYIDSGTEIYYDREPAYCDELGHDSEPKRAESNVHSKSHQVRTETDTNRGGDIYVKAFGKCDECSQNPEESLLTLPQIDSHIKIETEYTYSRQLAFNLNAEAFKCNSFLKLAGTTKEGNNSSGTDMCVEQEPLVSISAEYGNVRDFEDGFDDLDSLTPTNRSPHGSSSSDAGSHGTAVYCPGRFSPQSSDADVSSYAEDTIAENKPLRKIYSHQSVGNKLFKSRSHENIPESKKYLGPSFKKGVQIHGKVCTSPKTLTDLCIDKVLSLPHGLDILNVLGIHFPLRNPEKKHDCKNITLNTLMRDTVKSFQLLNAPSVSATYKSTGKSSLSGSLPDMSSMQQESLIRDQSSSINTMKSPPLPVSSPLSVADSDWMGMPTKEDPNLLVCLSPSQRQSYHQGESPTPEEAESLLDLHYKFVQRRGYNENPPPPPSRRVFGIHLFSDETHFPNGYLGDNCLNRDTDCQKPPSTGHYAESEDETSAACKHVLSPKFRAVLTSLDSKIPFKGNTRSVMDGLKDAQVEEKRELGVRENEDTEDGGGEKERGRSRSRSRLLAILRASSESQEIQAKHLSPSSSCSPPPLPPLPCTYQHQVEMLGFLQQSRRPTTFCCSSNDKDFDYLLQHGPPRSPSYKKQNSCDISLQSPTRQTKGGGDTSPCTSSIEGAGSKKERVLSWYGQGVTDGNNKERLKVKSLSDWLQLVRRGGSSKDSDGTRSKDPTPSVSACASTQSSPGPIRRDIRDPSPKPETNRSKDCGMKEHQKLKQEILERRFSLPERQLEQACQPDQKLVKPPLLPTSARDDERHKQQLKLLQQRQQRFRNEQLSNKTEQTQEKRPPLPQQQSKQKQLEPEVNMQELYCSHPVREQKQQSPVVQETQPVERRFDADNYRISKKGDIAIINSNAISRILKEEQSILRSKDSEDISRQIKSSQRPKSMPTPIESLVTSGEIFRQQMYVEYMDKVAERAERRRHKVIRLSSVPREDVPTSEPQDAAATAVQQLENEFMGRVRERMDKLGLKYDEESDDGSKAESGADNCYVISGGRAQEMGGGGDSVCHLPKHLQEFLTIAGGTGGDSDVDGVWSPSSKPSTDVTEHSNRKENQDTKAGEDAPPVVWTPKSAGASPSSERKEFRPVNFESPTLSRKNRNGTFTPALFKPADDLQPAVTTSPLAQESTTTTTFSSIFPPWQQQQSRDDSILSVGSTLQSPTSDKSVASSTITSTLDRRLVQSQSAPASGLSALAAGGPSNIKLPRAQNPTITLLQKAREGRLPRGALYLDHKMNSKEAEMPYVSPNDILYTVKKEYASEGESEQRKKIVELGPRKYEGIGPTTKEGIPIVLRSEVKDANQAKWYKRMYDSLHRAGKDDEYVTIRYKPRRGHYPYTSPGGYLSEPEPALYDSDIGYSAKYATLDRRRIKNKENDFTTSTLPRSRYVPHPASIKYATEVYKNQPGRIEDYEPGRSSISEKETKQWWDEVLDIFDGQTYAEPQTTPSTPSNKPFMTHALKESGYESDSTLVFKRRDENLQNQLSPAEQKLAYKTIQKGGEVPLHGLRKPAPERPKDISEIEYFPISPHLTRIRVHKQNITPLREIVCYPVTKTYTNVPPVFSSYKRTAPSFVQVTPRKAASQPPPPSPPKRQSSHHCSTLRLWSKMRLPCQPHTGPVRSRHESCFRDTNVNFLRDRISQKLGINSSNAGMRDRPVRFTRATSSSPLGARASLTAVNRSRSAPESFTSNRKTEVPSSKLQSRKVQHDPAGRLSRSPDLTSPMEVRKIVQKQKEKDIRERLGSRCLPPGTVVRSSTLLYSSARNSGLQYHPEDKSLHVTVAVSAKGRELLQPKTATSTASTMSSVTTTTTSCKSPSLSLSQILGTQRGSILSRQSVKSVSACHSSPLPSTSMLKTKYAVSPNPSASTPTKGNSRSASKEYMGAVSHRVLGSSGTAAPSLIELTMDEGNRRVRKSIAADVKKRTKERSLLSSVKTSSSVPKPDGKPASYSSDKGLEKEHKNNNKKKVKKSKMDSNGESRQAHVSKRSNAAKSSLGNKARVNSEGKQKNRTEKKLVSMPRTEALSNLSTVPDTKELLIQSDRLLDAIPQQSVCPLNTESFFQHLLLRDTSFLTQSVGSSLHRSSSVLERARQFHEHVTGRTHRRAPFKTESTLGLMNVYLANKRPVTDSKFRSLDRESSLSSRSPSPSYRSMTFPLHSHVSCLKIDNSRHEAEAGMFYSLSPSRNRTPDCDRRDVRVRSSSEPPLLSASTGAVSRSRSPRVDTRQETATNTKSSAPCQSLPSSPSPTRSAACRRIRGARSQIVKTVESIAGLRRKGFRARSAGDAEDAKQVGRKGLKTSPPLHAHSTSSLNVSHITDHSDYQSYVLELVHSTRKSERFRELHKFYSSLERLGQLERAASTGDLRPRLKGEEVIDYDRWKQLRTKEKAEKEMKMLYEKLKDDQKEKNLLFESKDTETLRWRGERDRGLLCRDKSVDNLKQHFDKLSVEETDLEVAKRKDLDAKKDLYKPLWRGSSVMNLASCLAAVTNSRRGRPVTGDSRVHSTSRSLTRHWSGKYGKGIGSRLWSSLSMDQVNALKTQLSEIYSSLSNIKRDKIIRREDYEIPIPPATATVPRPMEDAKETLHVRCNSLLTRDQLYSPLVRRREARRAESMKADSISSLTYWKKNGSKPKSDSPKSFVGHAKPLSETEKKRLSMTLSQEVLDRVSKKQKMSSVPVVRARETRGAIAAAAAKGRGKAPSPSSSPVLSDTISPRTCYSLEMSEEDSSERHASSSRKNDFLLVLTPSDGSHSRHREVQKVVEEWANAKPSTSRAVTSGIEGKTENGITARLVTTTSASETESASSDTSTKTVIHRTGSREDVLQKVEYFERKQTTVASDTTGDKTKAGARVCRSASDIMTPPHPSLKHSTRAKSAPGAFHLTKNTVPPSMSPCPVRLRPSQSYADLKELFGEQSRLRYATMPLVTRKGEEPTSSLKSARSESGKRPEDGNVDRSHQGSVSPSRAYCSDSSTDSLFHQRSRSVSPDPTKYWRAYLKMVKHGDVKRLCDKFESVEDLYYYSTGACRKLKSLSVLKRHSSDPELARDLLARRGTDTNRVVVRGQEVGDVRWLRRRYETCCRGRSRGRKARAFSPVLRIPFRAEDRFMPHINVISKTASLQRRSGTTSPQRQAIVSEDEGFRHFHIGEVRRIREKFESELSLMGQMFTSTPDVRELRDIAPYLGCHWVAHKFPDTKPNSRSLSSPELRTSPPVSRPSSRESRPRPASSSPTRSRRQPLSILKPQQPLQQRQIPAATVATSDVVPRRDVFANQAFDPSIHRPLYRYQPINNASGTGQRYAGSNLWCRQSSPRPTVTFKGADSFSMVWI